ncbi:Bud site selection protein 16 [Rhodotorula toruloides ATCC 204091]|uniref:pyridoxal kinase n=1 Tax=Rhodotorula toruloides TaxID=5286 RepID=A0A2T0A838_RHOTO|nr:Bud site selection protein 16 [Rhodotorula toruloides ATCC 204091]PRQ74192.1 Bud site selection protein 16 [Rhodotorula toruloides]
MAQANVTQEKRILSIQSHVVCGYVGNKSASFPLQLLGWEVDAALTVSFSNHTVRYGRWGGSKFDAAHLEDVFSALDANGLLRQSHVLTGYVPGADALKVVVLAVDRLRAINPSLVYILDPVMGDDGRIYVSESVIPIYKALLPRATCATPNYFEAELLTDIKILDATSLQLALRTFHERYRIPNIVVSAVSLPLSELVKLGFVDAPALTTSSSTSRMLVCAGSTLVSAPGEPLKTTSFGIAFPELAEHYEGVGDVFSALVAGRFPSASDPAFAAHPISPLARTVELAIASLQGILAKTRQHALSLAKGRADLIVPREGESAEERVRRLRTVELRLVQSQQEILNPDVKHRAVRFSGV